MRNGFSVQSSRLLIVHSDTSHNGFNYGYVHSLLFAAARTLRRPHLPSLQ